MTVHHDSAGQRFTTTVDGHAADLDYELQEGWIVITHTSVPQPIEGRGIASKLMRAAFEHAREQGWNVRPACSYAAAWAERHLEYNQLLG